MTAKGGPHSGVSNAEATVNQTDWSTRDRTRWGGGGGAKVPTQDGDTEGLAVCDMK